jgi:hypothetical protein
VTLEDAGVTDKETGPEVKAHESKLEGVEG